MSKPKDLLKYAGTWKGEPIEAESSTPFDKAQREAAVNKSRSSDGLVVANLIASALENNISKMQRACRLITACNISADIFRQILNDYADGKRE